MEIRRMFGQWEHISPSNATRLDIFCLYSDSVFVPPHTDMDISHAECNIVFILKLSLITFEI